MGIRNNRVQISGGQLKTKPCSRKPGGGGDILIQKENLCPSEIRKKKPYPRFLFCGRGLNFFHPLEVLPTSSKTKHVIFWAQYPKRHHKCSCCAPLKAENPMMYQNRFNPKGESLSRVVARSRTFSRASHQLHGCNFKRCTDLCSGTALPGHSDNNATLFFLLI